MSINSLIKNNIKQIKTFLVLLAVFCLNMSGLTVFAQHPSLGGGNGTNTDPYKITTATQLKALADYVNAGNSNEAANKYYKLLNNIDLSGYDNWKPIGNNNLNNINNRFRGNFDGNGKMVQNITINRPTETEIGLFGYIYQANIQNLGVENCNILGG